MSQIITLPPGFYRELAACAARWPGKDVQAMRHLLGRGYTLTENQRWLTPSIIFPASARDLDAVEYLSQEFDHQGWAMHKGQLCVLFEKSPYAEDDFHRAYLESVRSSV